MSFTVKLYYREFEKASTSDGVLVQRLYSCRTLDFKEDGELVLYGLNGSHEDAVMHVDANPYERVYVTDDSGRTVLSHTVPSAYDGHPDN